MSTAGMTAEIRSWASARGGVPFTVSVCYEQTKLTDNVKDVADRVRGLWVKGDLARRKVDNVRFEYVWGKFAEQGVDGWEFCDGEKPVKAKPAPKPAAPPSVQPFNPAATVVAPSIHQATEDEPRIPDFLRKDTGSLHGAAGKTVRRNRPAPDHIEQPLEMVGATPSPASGRGAGGEGAFTAESIADALIAKLRPLLNRQRLDMALDNTHAVHAALANHHLDTADALEVSGSRITVRIEKLEISVEGVL